MVIDFVRLVRYLQFFKLNAEYASRRFIKCSRNSDTRWDKSCSGQREYTEVWLEDGRCWRWCASFVVELSVQRLQIKPERPAFGERATSSSGGACS